MSMKLKQNGSVLIISLMLLIVMTILGLSSINSTIMEERMAGNLRNSNLSFMAAESALRSAEQKIADYTKNTKPEATETGSSDVWILDYPDQGYDPGVDDYPSEFWWATNPTNWWTAAGTGIFTNNSTEYDASGSGALTSYYVIEYMQPICDTLNVGQQSDMQSCRDFYQATALGLGPGGIGKTYLRTTIARRY